MGNEGTALDFAKRAKYRNSGILLAALVIGCAEGPPAAVTATEPAPVASTSVAPAPDCAPQSIDRPSLSSKQLEELEALGALSKSTALVVLDHGKAVVVQGQVDRPLELMSVTKSIVSLIFGQLIAEHHVRLEQPVADFVPAWRGTPKESIQVLHLLANTSGLADKQTTEDIYASDSFVQFAIDAELKSEPGKSHFYSNRASNLLARVAKAASGSPLDAWAREHLFGSLGMELVGWSHDKAGDVQVMAGIQMSAQQLAKIGQLVADGGRWCGQSVVPADWIRASTAYQDIGFRPHGLLWWLTPESTSVGFSAKLFEQWRQSGVPEDFIAKFRPLQDRYFDIDGKGFFEAVHLALNGRTDKPTDKDLAPWYAMTWQAGRPDGEVKHGPVKAIVGDGYGGQVLLIYPEKKVVVARLRDVSGMSDVKEKTKFAKVADGIVSGGVPAP